MIFVWPIMLLSLSLIPLFVILYLFLQRRRNKFAARYGSLGLVQEAGGRGPGYRRHIPPVLFLIGLIILMLALGRPQTVVRIPRVEGTVILAFDVSGSMAADDLKPSRMEAAKAAARGFVEHQPASVEIGIVAFSDGGFAVQPPTNEKQVVLESIDRLRPQRGTALGQGIIASLNTIATAAGETAVSSFTDPGVPPPTPVPAGTYTSAVIVLLTDGENNQNPDPLAAAQAAADRGVRIYTVGIGSPEGAILQIDDFRVHTQLNEALLQQIALITDGAYYAAGNEVELQAIYDNINLELVVESEQTEVTSIFAGASILVLLISGTISLLWFSRWP